MTKDEQFEAYWSGLNDVECYGEECHMRIAQASWQARGELDAVRIAELEALEQPTNMVTVPLDKLEDMQRRLKTSQEPVAWTTKFALEVCKDKLAFEVSPTNIWDSNGVALYTHPPKEWQGLSDEEIKEIHTSSAGKDIGFATGLTEAKLREKNS